MASPWEKYGTKSGASNPSAAKPWDRYTPADHVHPDDITDEQGHIVPANPMAQGPGAPAQTAPMQPAQSGPLTEADGWSQPTIVPIQHNRKTGEWRFGDSAATAAASDAMRLPQDVLNGQYNDQLGPGGSFAGLSPALAGRALGFASTFAGGLETPKAGPLKALGNAPNEFGIPLTKGQALGDLPALTKEEAIRQGQGPAANIMRNFDAGQRDKIAGVTDTIGSQLGANPESMPDLVKQAIQDKVAFHKDQAASLYSIAQDGGVSVKPEMVDALSPILSAALEKDAVHVSPTLTPGAAEALKLIEQDTAKMTGALSDAAKEPGAIAGSGGITLEGIEQLRKKLVFMGQGANPTDARALSAIKRAFDDWTQTAVDNMLISGDDAALESLKKARAASKDYLSITEPRSGDAAGAAVAKMQKGDATAEEVANWLYGADVASPTLNAPKVAERVKTLVGADSQEWGAVRASAWDRLVKDPRSATGEPLSNTMIAKRIETFLNDKGTSLSKVLYTDDERAQMQRFADVLKQTVTPRDATNPSRTAWTLTGSVNAITRMLTGGAVASVAGPQAGAAAYFAMPVFKSIGARRAAKIATGAAEPFAAAPLTRGPALGLTRVAGEYLGQSGALGANDNGLAPSVAVKPVGPMSLGDWVKQQSSNGKLAV